MLHESVDAVNRVKGRNERQAQILEEKAIKGLQEHRETIAMLLKVLHERPCLKY